MSVASPPLLREQRKYPALKLVLGIAASLILAAVVVFLVKWPFTETAVLKSLEDASSSKVSIGRFRQSYFPYPGCIAEQVTFVRTGESNGHPLITIPRLVIRSSYLGLLLKHVSEIDADGIHVFIPAASSHQKFQSTSNVAVDKLRMDEATLEFESKSSGKAALKFAVHECRLQEIGGTAPVLFQVELSNPEPPGEIAATGKLGPWLLAKPGQTAVSGNYRFDHADLGAFQGIAGRLSSTGRFDGVLQRIEIHGSTDTPDFEVTHSHHNTELENTFHAFVNALTGDVFLEQVDSRFRNTRVISKGSIARQSGEGARITELDMTSRDARIDDILRLFDSDPTPPMAGATSLHAHVLLPSDRRAFLKKVEMHGDFGIEAGNFTNSKTQEDVDKLSAESRGENDKIAATVLSDLKGHAEVKNGLATFSHLSFKIPGAAADMHGTYDLISQKINLHGTLNMDSSLSHTGHGPKALILKVMNPFFRRKPKGASVPVKITGTYDKPSFGLDLGGGEKRSPAAKRLEKAYQVRRK
jgi:hypothetical protein